MNPLHTFHIPVMGLAYTIDTPIKVARFGISSVMSIIQDNLVEKMRSHYYHFAGEPYLPIPVTTPDYRAKRITDYLNLVNRIVLRQIEKLKAEPLTPGSEIEKYFEMLPPTSALGETYHRMKGCESPDEKSSLQSLLRSQIVPGSIDVNIMTKLDKNNTDSRGNQVEDGSDAVAALRGYANSDLQNSSIIFSAGMNPRLFSYLERLNVFDADLEGTFQKKIIIKVSDYRSALIQGKLLAKKGLWVSEFRIESGLNCGGHAFASDGYLLGPILEEFKINRDSLTAQLFEMYNHALEAKGKRGFTKLHPTRITVQGGIGTWEEDEFLRQHYKVDATGWGTPFLLVPEATTVDDETLQLLQAAREADVVLSKNSPLGVRFHYLKGTTAEKEKHHRISRGVPGSPCTEKFLVSNTEFTAEPICTASRKYQKKKIEQLQSLNLPQADYEQKLQDVLAKECLCTGLSNAALKKYTLKPLRNPGTINICPGPNIAYFSEITTLQKMVDHIYGRISLLMNSTRPHMFIKELSLYIDYWAELVSVTQDQMDDKKRKYVQAFYDNILRGIDYYRKLSGRVSYEAARWLPHLEQELKIAEEKIKSVIQSISATLVLS